MKKEKVLLSWCGGKNAVVSLFELKSPEYKLDGLLTLVSPSTQRVHDHGLPFALVQKQAECLEMPLHKVEVAETATDEEMAAQLMPILKPLIKKNLRGVAYGNVSNETHKKKSDNLWGRFDLRSVYPIWGWKTAEVMRVLFGLNYKSIVVAVDSSKVSADWLGQPYDKKFVDGLASSVHPLGENGEFHTFAYDGPFFQRAVPYTLGDRITQGSMIFQDFKLS